MRKDIERPSIWEIISIFNDLLSGFGRLTHKYGDITELRFGRKSFFIISNPSDIRSILLTQQDRFNKGSSFSNLKKFVGNGLITIGNGPIHKKRRNLIQTIFSHNKLIEYARIIVDLTQNFISEYEDGSVIDLYAETEKLTLLIIGKILFSADFEHDSDIIRKSVSTAMETTVKVRAKLLNDISDRLPLPSNFAYRNAHLYLSKLASDLVEAHFYNEKADLISLLLSSGEAVEQIRDEVLTFLIAGYETIASALTWSWYLLSTDFEVRQKLYQELKVVLQGRLPIFADLPKLIYTKMILTEAMRLYPPIWMMGRVTEQDTYLSEKAIPCGASVIMSQYLVHRDPRWFTDPEQFAPERWDLQSIDKPPKSAYFPFGGGPRVCIGESFAWMEGVFVLATIAQRWEYQTYSQEKILPKPLVTLCPPYGLKVILRRR